MCNNGKGQHDKHGLQRTSGNSIHLLRAQNLDGQCVFKWRLKKQCMKTESKIMLILYYV